jgi:hypothetical protein
MKFDEFSFDRDLVTPQCHTARLFHPYTRKTHTLKHMIWKKLIDGVTRCNLGQNPSLMVDRIRRWNQPSKTTQW